MPKYSDDEVDEMLSDYQTFKGKVEPILDDYPKTKEAVAGIQTAALLEKATENERIKKTIATVHKSWSYRLQTALTIILALIAIYAAFAPRGDKIDYTELAQAIREITK